MSCRKPFRAAVYAMGLRLWCVSVLSTLATVTSIPSSAGEEELTSRHLYVNPQKGRDRERESGSIREPFLTISYAISVIPQNVPHPVTIHLMAGHYQTTGGHGMPENHLVLRRRTAPRSYISLKGEGGADAGEKPVILDWVGTPMVTAFEGRWGIGNVQLGTRNKKQREGFVAEGSGSLLDLTDIRVRTASHSGSGILAERAGMVHLYGTIELNEDLHEKCEDKETFCRILATDHGRVKFMQTKGASLSIGNGGLGASYYGTVRLGCERAEISSWADVHPLAIGNSGRIDLGGTETHFRTMSPDGVLIAAEDDGHILAEKTHVVLESGPEGSGSAIRLQKASTLFGGPFEIKGSFRGTIVTMSGSVFVGKVVGNLDSVDAYTGSHVSLQSGSSLLTRIAHARAGATIVHPSGEVLRERFWKPQD